MLTALTDDAPESDVVHAWVANTALLAVEAHGAAAATLERWTHQRIRPARCEEASSLEHGRHGGQPSPHVPPTLVAVLCPALAVERDTFALVRNVALGPLDHRHGVP